MQQLYFSLDKTNQLGKFKRVQTCNSYVSHCAFRVDFQCGNAEGNDQEREKQQWKHYLAGEA